MIEPPVRKTQVIASYLKSTPATNKETGGRKFFTQPIIERIQQMGDDGGPEAQWAHRRAALAGEPEPPDVLIKRLTTFNPRFDSPPYPFADMLVVDTPSGHPVKTDLSFTIGGKTYSAPIIIGEFSYGATQREVHQAVAKVAMAENFLFGVGEGGVEPSIASNLEMMAHIIVQDATGLFGLNAKAMRAAAMVTIKYSQIAKTGMGGMLPREKAEADKVILQIRGMPEGMDILSDASKVISIEEMRAHTGTINRITGKPVLSKVGATHSFRSVAAGSMRSGAAGIIVDGLGGGTGAAPNIHRDYIGMTIEQASVLAYEQKLEMKKTNDLIIAAGRVDTPEKIFKLNLLGPDGAMLATAALIALGCKVVNMCHKECPVALTAINKLPSGDKKKVLQVEWAVQVLTNFYRAFTAEYALILGAYGFKTPAEAVGRKDLVHGVNLPPRLAAALGIENEITGNVFPVPLDKPQKYFEDLLENLASTGKPKITSMGRTTDLDSPYSNLDRITHEGRTVVGPAYDSYRETIETLVWLPSGIKIGMPIILEGDGKETARLARETNTVVLGNGNNGDYRRTIMPIKPDSIGTDYYKIRESAGVILASGEVTNEAMTAHRLYSPETAVYVHLKASKDAPEEAARLVRLGVKGLIMEGGLSMKSEVPIDVAMSQVDHYLASQINRADGKILRNIVKLGAKTKIRSSRDEYALHCLGADFLVCNLSELISNPTYQRQLNLKRGLKAELQMLMGASGLSMMSSIIGNRNILRADFYLQEETAKLLGVDYIGS